MDALTFLTSQHNEVEVLFKRAKQTQDADDRAALVEQIDNALRVHAWLEEELFYPQLRARAERSDERLDVAQALEEHRLVRIMLEAIEQADADSEEYQAKLEVLIELVQRHVDEEESALFKIAHRLFTKDELEAIGDRLRDALTTLAAR